jgi:hypothetical protein
MGQEIHRQGLIVSSEINGTDVVAELAGDHFSLAMLQMHLQTEYSDAHIVNDEVKWSDGKTKVIIRFANPEDAMHFHLRH